MVRNYVRKTYQGSWREDNMKEALESIMKEMGIRQAAKAFNVSKTSLHRRLKRMKECDPGDNNIHSIFKNSLGRFWNALSDSQEELKQYIINILNSS